MVKPQRKGAEKVVNLYSINVTGKMNMMVMMMIVMMRRLMMVTTLKTVSTLLVTTVEPGRLRSTSVVTPISS